MQGNPALSRSGALAAFEAALSREGTSICVPPSSSAESIEADIRAHLCEPFYVSAQVEEPGFPFAAVGTRLQATCFAHSEAGHWLVYQPEASRFLCFWGSEPSRLGAHGVYGNPLYCWSA